MRAIAIGLMIIASAGLIPSSAGAEEHCLAAPSRPAPPGSEWYSELDQPSQRKCWHLRAHDQRGQAVGAQERTDETGSIKPPLIIVNDEGGETLTAPKAKSKGEAAQARVAPEPRIKIRRGQQATGALSSKATQGSAKPHPVTWPEPPSRTVTGAIWPDPPASPVAKAAWPDVPPQQAADTVVWPDPPIPATAAPNRASEGSAKEGAAQTRELRQSTVDSESTAGNAGRKTQSTKPIPAAVSHDDLPVALLWTIAIGFLILGMLLRWTVRRVLARRRIAYQAGKLNQGDEVKVALKKLLRVLEQETAT